MSTLAMLDAILGGGKDYPVMNKESINVQPGSANLHHEDADAKAAVARIFELKQSITSCDDVLTKIEDCMSTFQAELLSVTSDIEALQSRSDEMSKRLKHRKELEALLGPAIEESVLSPQIIRKIIEAPVDRSWISSLETLEQFSENERKERLIEAAFPSKEVEKLRSIAVSRIRDYLVTKIKTLRLPKTNVSVVQQSLLKLRKLFSFLCKYHQVLSSEIMQAYCLTMRWYYQYSFERYQRSLSRIQIRNITKQELLGAEDVPRSLGSMFSTAQKSPTKKDSNLQSVMSLGTRAKYLHDNTSGIILAHLAETEKETFFVERVFRSYIVALIENAAVEYLFMNEFFKTKGARSISEHYNTILDPVFSSAQTFVKSLVSDSLDVIGVLTCIRVCQKLSFDLQKRKVAGLESFLDILQITLWPRLQSIMDLHCQALKTCSVSVSSVTESARSKTPLPLTKRFTDLVFGILALSKNAREEEPVSHSLDRLIHDYESCLTRMAATCDAKLRNQFLFSNYLCVAEQIENTSGTMADKHQKAFRVFVESLRS